MDSVKYSQSDLCALVNYGRPANLFYFCEWGLETHGIPLPEIAAQLQLLTPDREVVFPTSFLLNPKGRFIQDALNQLTCKKRLMIMLGDEEAELVILVKDLVSRGWAVDLQFDRPLSFEILKRLEDYDNSSTRLIFVANHLSNQFVSLQSIPESWRSRSYVTFLSPGKRHDIFLNPDEVMLFQDDWIRAISGGKYFEPRVLSYKPINLPEPSFFSEPTKKNYGANFTTLGEMEQLRHLLKLSSGVNWPLRAVFSTVIYAAIRPLAFGALPVKRLFYFVEFQLNKYLKFRTFRTFSL